MLISNTSPMIYTVEDCLEIMTAYSEILVSPPFELLERDKKILQSIASKTFKGIGLTDKQLAVVKKYSWPITLYNLRTEALICLNLWNN